MPNPTVGHPKPSVEGPLLVKFGFSLIAASCSEATTYPLDLTKTRLQIQGEKAAKDGLPRSGFFRMGINIITNEGLTKLYFGMSPAIYRHMIYTTFRMSAYQYVRPKMGDQAPLYQKAGLGLFCGGVGQFLANPFDLVKVQMQAEGRRKLQGLPPRVEVGKHNFSAYFKAALRAGGWRSLWAGCWPNVQRSALVNLGDLTAYDSTKNYLLKAGFTESRWLYFMSSMGAGLVSAILGTPADVIKTRMMNQPLGPDGKGLYYSSSITCLKQAIVNEGFFSLYKGFLPCWLRMAPWSMTFWFVYEELCNISGYRSI